MLLLSPGHSATAVELFGIQLNSAKHDELSGAARAAGVELISEGGDANWFDVFDSQSVLPGSSRLYLGYVKQDRRFAFAEYEFVGLRQPQMLGKLREKYGEAEIIEGNFISDKTYRWLSNGTEILLRSDWRNYRTRLSYIAPPAMIDLRKEQLAAQFAY